MNAAWKNYSLTPKKAALKRAEKFKSSDACRLCGICLKNCNQLFRRKEQHISGPKIYFGSLKAWLTLTKFAWDIF